MRVCCCTSFTFAYAPRALVLAETVRRAHPGWTLAAAVVDRHPTDVPSGALLPEFDIVLGAEGLGIPDVGRWLFRHELVEACTAVKGALLNRLLDLGFEAVIYLDPDTALFAPLTPVLSALDSSSIVLTPHQSVPNLREQALVDNEMTSLLYGTYNLGFIAVRNDAAGRAFGAWWAAMLHRACYDEPERGLFTDQRYIDLVPGLFDGVHVLRDPGCNVASWNLSTRRVTAAADGALLVNGSTLRFFHFTKVGGIGDVMLERYGGDQVEVHELLAWYRRRLDRHAGRGAGQDWHYGRFSNGVPIPRGARRLYRTRPDLVAHFAAPFDADGADTYHGWLLHEHPGLLAG